MKLDKNTVIKAKHAVNAKQSAKNGKGIAKAKLAKSKVFKAIALLKGKRGLAARLVEVTQSGQDVSIRALQTNLGLTFKSKAPATPAKLVNGVLKGNRQSRIELGGYVNGKSTGAKVELVTPEAFNKRSKPCLVHWNQDDKGVSGRYIGNPSQKGMLAVVADYPNGFKHYWQMEQDSNANNAKERGAVKPLTKNGKLAIVA